MSKRSTMVFVYEYCRFDRIGFSIRHTTMFCVNGGRSWIRTSEGVSQQIYSLPPLATWVSYRAVFDFKRRAI